MEEGRTEEGMKQQQDDHHHRRLKLPLQSENLPQPQQPQKCPRCGTLRNVPVGGGCRKGKRVKSSSSSADNSRSQQSPPPQLEQNLTPPSTMISTTIGNSALPPAMAPPIASYYSGGGFLSSLGAMQSLSQPQPFNQQPVNLGGQFGGASNLALLQGFNVPSVSSSRQAQPQQIQQQTDFYQMGNRDKIIEPLHPTDQSLIQPNRSTGSWNRSLLISNTANPTASNPSLWNSSGTHTTGTSLNPNQWPDLTGYGPPT
ncbi:hypothetical protein F0562_014024 [Nyssa sinensis]|uniref:Dof-type domain-containing protein n=1 Tax=Nyssa sinensis TaxID=561372 RepID=A0A5J4ZQ02_9ASTE|nr:hypothetical protein F0562_014024 [Nyssa sinensis]